MIEHAVANDNQFFLSMDTPYVDSKFGDTGLYKSFASYPSYKDFFNILKDFNENEKISFYELIIPNQNCKMFADLEWSLDDWSIDEVKEKFYHVVNMILTKLKLKPLTISDSDWLSASDFASKKGSLHYISNQYYFNDIKVQGNFWNHVFQYMVNQEIRSSGTYYYIDKSKKSYMSKCFIDGCVYSKVRNFRTIHSSKIKDFEYIRPFEPISTGRTNYKKYFVTSFKSYDGFEDISNVAPTISDIRLKRTIISIESLEKIVLEYGLEDTHIRQLYDKRKNNDKNF
jgi:hypothetical protein